ncbi:MAG TPA: site-specific integrase [Desulfobacteraceae bacterium]|nr:site-specific integrase [Desulfobacteraceae bacterium]
MGLWRDKTRKDWCYSFQYQTQTYAGRGFKTKAEARTAREERRKLVKGQKIETGMAYSEAVNLYLDHAQKAFTSETYKYKKYVYSQLWLFMKEFDFPMHEITTPMLKAYLDTRHSNNNFNVHRRELSALFTYARDILEVITTHPLRKIKKLPHQVRSKTIPRESDIVKLIQAADPETDERDLLLTVLHTLARIDEILKLTWDDINFEKRLLSKWTRKSGDSSPKEIRVNINDELYDVLWNRWQNREQDTWVFYNQTTKTRYLKRPKFMKGLCKRAGIPPMGFHTLRHFMSSLLDDNPKISTKTIQKILGHASKRTTEIYLHELDGSIETAMDSISGKFSID